MLMVAQRHIDPMPVLALLLTDADYAQEMGEKEILEEQPTIPISLSVADAEAKIS